jgi:hypothetical protein
MQCALKPKSSRARSPFFFFEMTWCSPQTYGESTLALVSKLIGMIFAGNFMIVHLFLMHRFD